MRGTACLEDGESSQMSGMVAAVPTDLSGQLVPVPVAHWKP